ncbi:MAG: GvpL/GvpF family gas vesicle protein, partial [archaeon]
METLKTSQKSKNFQELDNFDDTQIEVSGRGQYLYVYGIISLKDLKSQKPKDSGSKKSELEEDILKFNFNGLREKPIIIISYEDIGALVSKYSFLNPILNEKESMEHADILKKIAKKITVIPMAFGN